MKLALATDHAGFEVLKELKLFLEELGHECVDYGPREFNAEDDYPDFIFPAARAVADGQCERGVIFGGSGQGEAMAANRVPGVRAAVFYGPVVAKTSVDAEGNLSTDPYEIVKLSRQHNDANILSLSGRFLSLEEAKTALKVWLETPFSSAERHARRLQKLDIQEGAA
ncbi:ribose-5-phosphate isomerase [Candidatus Saccharibacteria bacterium]|nr:MAG: ribose-5-phosphate isomerase [Candidatus Saccharibacteria bacterium]PID99248.1 MAG: ribose-5-phosphate isomerase [Candidatus Saccharibacteria bacterium]